MPDVTGIRPLDPTGILEPLDEAEHYEPDEVEKALMTELESRWTEAEQSRGWYDDEVEHNRTMLRGDTIVARDTTTGDVSHIVLSNYSRLRLSTDNNLRGINRALVGKHTRLIPSVEVMPGTGDESDVRSAEIATTFLEYFAHKERLPAKYVKAHRLLGSAGTMVWQPYWDRRAGQELAWCSKCNYTGANDEVGDPCPLCEQEAQMESDEQFNQALESYGQQYSEYKMETSMALEMGAPPTVPEPEKPVRAEPMAAPPLESTREGDVRCRALDPMEFYPEPGVEDMEDMRWACVRRAVPVSKIREMFPAMAKYIKSEEDIKLQGQARRYGQTSRTYGYVVSDSPKDHAYLYEWHERPTQLYPKGRLIYVCNDIVMNQTEEMLGEDSPYYMLPTLPFYPFHWERTDNVFWGEGPITQSWPLQVERNDELADMRDHRKRTNRPPLLTPMGSKLANSDFHNIRAGTVLKYKAAAAKPDFMKIPPFASYQYQDLERLRLGMQEKASVTDHEMGISGAGESGRYAALLEAQSSESIRPILLSNSVSWLEFNRAVVVIGQEYYAPDRVWTIRGRDKFWSYDWASVNMSPGWDVRLAETDSLSQNPALRLEQAERLLGNGVFNDPMTGIPDMDKFAKVAGLKDLASAPDPDASMRSYAASIPELILEEKFTGPKTWDDAKICDQEMLSWLRGPGRSRPMEEQMAVGQVWLVYSFAANQGGQLGPGDANLMPNQALAQQQPQPGGNGGMGAGAMPQERNPVTEAAGAVQQADQAGEAAANPGPHES
jgi:rubrerythrin